MKHIYPTLIILLTSCSVISQVEYSLQKCGNPTAEIDHVITTYEDLGFSTFCDQEFTGEYLKFWNNIEHISQGYVIDSASCSPYGSEIFVYKSEPFEDYLILWVIEDEYASEIHILYLKNGTIIKVGNLPIRDACETCDVNNYPIDKINIIGDETKITINLLTPFLFEISPENWGKSQPGQIRFIIKKRTKELIWH